MSGSTKAYKAQFYGISHEPKSPLKAQPKKYIPISREVINNAAYAFARQEIDLFTLMRTITPQDKWKPEWVAEKAL